MASSSFLDRLSADDLDQLAHLARVDVRSLTQRDSPAKVQESHKDRLHSREGQQQREIDATIPLQRPRRDEIGIAKELAKLESELYDEPLSDAQSQGDDYDDCMNSNTMKPGSSQYMKAIWELRRSLQSSEREKSIVESRLEQTEMRYTNLQQELSNVHKIHRQQVTQLVQQVEQLMTRDQQQQTSNKEQEHKNLTVQSELEHVKSSEARLRKLLSDQFVIQERKAKRMECRERQLEKLTTQKLLDSSQPPPDFPAAQIIPFTKSEFIHMRQRLHRTEELHAQLKLRCIKLQTKNDQVIKARTHTRKTMESKFKVQQAHLVGAVRRIQWLLHEKQNLHAQLNTLKTYVSKLESKLLKQSRRLVKSKTTTSRERQLKGMSRFSRSCSPTVTKRNDKRRRGSAAIDDDDDESWSQFEEDCGDGDGNESNNSINQCSSIRNAKITASAKLMASKLAAQSMGESNPIDENDDDINYHNEDSNHNNLTSLSNLVESLVAAEELPFLSEPIDYNVVSRIEKQVHNYTMVPQPLT